MPIQTMPIVTRWLQRAGLTLGLLLCTLAASAQPAALRIWSAGAAQAPMTELTQAYSTRQATSLQVDYAPVGVLMSRLAAGGQPDVLILSQDVAAAVAQAGWCDADNTQALGSVGVGVAVKEGAHRPDISSPEALRQTLLDAKSITYINPSKGTSGKHFAEVLQRLGIREAVQSKTTFGEAGYVVEPVARGEVELGIQQITEILPVPGVSLLGPLPPALQKNTTYTVCVTRFSPEKIQAKAFMQYLLEDGARRIFVAKGFTVP